jgi:hypothetical protein
MTLKSALGHRSVNIGGRKSGAVLFLFAACAVVLTFSTDSLSATPQTPNGWQTVKDKTGACQMSVPGNWATIPGSPGSVASPEHIMSVLLAGYKRSPAPMTDAEKHEFAVDKMIENSANRWLYATKPVPAQNVIAYHVNVPISNHVCAAVITVKVGHSEDEIKKIAATVGAAK